MKKITLTDADTRLRESIVAACKQALHPNFDAYIFLGTYRDEHDQTMTIRTHGGNQHAISSMVREMAIQMEGA